jgi:hypothetical protein
MIKTSLLFVLVASAVLIHGQASAQGVNLTGNWKCVAACEGPPGALASITQYGWNLNVVSSTGQASRAWVDYPGRIWLQTANQGAIYSPDGMRLQFDRGSVWLRAPDTVIAQRRK